MATPPSLPTTWTDGSVRLGNLKDAINDLATAVNLLGAVGHAGWSSWTPALTASSSNPSWGTHGTNGCVIRGRRAKLGRLTVATFNLRAATTGATAGSGTLYVSTPETLKSAGYDDGMTSDWVGFGKLYRGATSPDLLPGAHLDCSLHLADGATGNKVLGVLNPGALGGSIDRASVTASQTGIGTSATDLTGLSVSVTPPRAGVRYRVTLDVHVWKAGGTDPNLYVQVTDASNNVLRRSAGHATILGSAFGTGLVQLRVEFIDENPTVGSSRTYKARAFGLDDTMGLFASAEVPATLTVEELAGVSTSGLSEASDYVSTTNPWEWHNRPGAAQFWGLLVAETDA